MGHAHGHDHAHPHTHSHTSDVDETTAAALDLSVADTDLSPRQLSRRDVFRAAGVLGGAAALGGGMTGVTPAMAAGEAGPAPSSDSGVRAWLAGDHHIHTQYSGDGIYRVVDQVRHGRAYGLDWMVITDHGGAQHARIGVELVNPDIAEARARFEDTLVFQGLEWNIPAAEHGTVFVVPGSNEVAVLKEFENGYDGSVVPAELRTEAQAVAGVQWLGQQVDARRVQDALFLANHPARRGIDSPHEVRAWRDADPRIAIGWEGAPGHQAAGIRTDRMGIGEERGFYGNAPGAASFPGYPAESYRTWGGFDFYTSTVGGLWDSLLAEGKPWSISANSDSHYNHLDTAARGPGSNFEVNGFYDDPVYSGTATPAGDFWPGFYSRTHVGVDRRSYAGVMRAMRDGRMWVDHGRLVKSLDMRVRRVGRTRGGTPLGSTVRAGRRPLELAIRIELQDLPNWAQFVPTLNRVDLILGMIDVEGPADRDSLTAPDTRVVQQWDTSGSTGVVELTYPLDPAQTQPYYLRVRGTDGNRSQPGFYGAAIDPAGPAIDVEGDADPWLDLWFYTNPIFVVPGV